MDASAVAAILRSVRATAEADPAAALPTLVATVGVVVAPLAAAGGGFSADSELDALAILRVLLARREGRAAAAAHGVEATVRALAARAGSAAPVRAAAEALLAALSAAEAAGSDGEVAAPGGATSAAAAAAAPRAAAAGPLRAVTLRMEGLLGAGRASRADEDRYVAALLQAASVDVTSVTVDARRERCVCYTREPEVGAGAGAPGVAPLRSRLYAVVQRVADALRDEQGRPRVDVARRNLAAARAYGDDDEDGEADEGAEGDGDGEGGGADENFFALVASTDGSGCVGGAGAGGGAQSVRERLAAAAASEAAAAQPAEAESGPVAWLAKALTSWW
jgi:hypothetical protein